MYNKDIFRFSCFTLIFSFVVLLFTPFITGFLSKSIYYTDANKYGVITGVIAFFGILVSSLIAHSIYRKEHPIEYNSNLDGFDDIEDNE